MRNLIFKSLILLLLSSGGCKNLILFSIEDDKKLGAQVSAEIASKPKEFPVLNQKSYPFAYKYLNGIRDKILRSGKVDYQDEFAWELKIIQNDTVLNAFATPGGYIYVYTGLIKYLDKEDDLAGVLGHEIAHADKRHSIRQLQKVYGIQILLSIALGQNPSQLEQIVGGLAGNLATLRFSREHEEEADDYSVVYLAQTPYQCNGAYSFFQKMLEEQKAGQVPKF
ncbi:MAG: M48 family metalloprotease, partial [Cyclobacteriaceae bacterium]